ncbi:probable fatty acyl-CoA reductase 4 [Phoenix dactylifera]|uniref:Fatty acyl-CoA reductase n=1 Tax=Phoenix dactylifera TaxID=42345 RepID=A0A8B7CKX0_PHODC|nr:probable fatty acyl-CoA reductase 4 [Phoenix dactylifera]
MEAGGIPECLKDKNILVTGSTGFLAKIFVEKVLRVQPNVKKLFLLVRAVDNTSAMRRVQTEVIGKELFKILKESHGNGFHSFIAEKLFPIAGDIIHENLGIRDSDLIEELWKKIDIVVNVAATTNFDERYDVALDVNVFGAKHVLEFAKKCVKLEMLLHVSSAFVSGMKEGLILEKPFHMGQTLKENSYLDIEAELQLVEEKKRKLHANKSMEDAEDTALKEMGMKRAEFFGWPNTYVYTKAMGEMLLGHLRGDLPLVILRPTMITSIYKEPLPGWIEGTRTIDSLIIGYAKGKLSCFFGEPELVMDVVPGDMVVNAMIVTMASHLNQRSKFIYHMSSGVRNPVTYAILEQCGFRYFLENPRVGKDGKTIKTNRMSVFRTMSAFHAYVTLRYRLPLEVLHLVNLIFCRLFDRRYKELSRKFKFMMHLVYLYSPYAFFKGCFDDINLERLRMTMMKDNVDATLFNFDPKSIDWKDYFYRVHIPGVLKYVCK